MTIKNQPKAEQLAVGKWSAILHRAGLDERFFTKRQGPCPMCGGNTRFRFIDIDGTGRHYCNKCGPGDGFKLLMDLLGCDFRKAADWIRAELDSVVACAAPTSKQLPEKVELDDQELRSKYERLWHAAKPLAPGGAGYRYLTRRVPGFACGSWALREVQSLDYWELAKVEGVERMVKLGSYAALIAAVQGPSGELVNLWRSYLTELGEKAPVTTPKKAAGRFLGRGGAVRLFDVVDGVLGVAEGIETAVSAHALFGIPTWACLSDGGLKSFELPSGVRVRRLEIFQDNDAPDHKGRRAGNEAASALRDRIRSDHGIEVCIRSPAGTGYDFNDVWLNVASRRRRAA